MPKPYTPDQRAEAIERLKANRGNVARTHQQTGIPERTLRDWRHQMWLAGEFWRLPPSPPSAAVAAAIPEAASTSDGDEDAEALKFVRRQIIREMVDVAASLKDSLDMAAPYHRVLALSQLLDRLAKLDAYIPKTAREQVIRIEYKDPDGSIHSTPIYQRMNLDWDFEHDPTKYEPEKVAALYSRGDEDDEEQESS